MTRAPAALFALGAALLLSGCGTTPARYSDTRPPVSGHPRYTVAAYQVDGVWYYPKVDYGYDETGTASWYGPQFDQRPTANGEIFDMNRVSAAHKTLPLPSVVEVTNLNNGRALELRVNDRGPFVGDRLIDVSRRAAQLLGFQTAGTAPVRIRILKEESIAVAEAAMHGEPAPVLAANAMPAAAAPRRQSPQPPAPAPALVQIAAPPPPPASPPARLADSGSAIDVAPAIAARPEAETLPAAEVKPAVAPAAPVAVALSPRSFATRIEAALFPPAAAATYEPPRGRPRPIAAVAPTGRIFVQAGAFSQRDNAERVQARIARLGAVQVSAALVNGTELYRVRLGPVSDVEAAHALLARVVESGYAGARIVSD